MRGFFLFLAICGALAIPAPAHSAGKYGGWSSQDCVNMGKHCIDLCDKSGVPETKAGCMFNCTSTAMQCVDIVKGDAAVIGPGPLNSR